MLKIKKVLYQKRSELKSSFLILEFDGAGVSIALVNTIRRLALRCVPVYSFCKESINIEKNTSIFNNDYMKLRISQMDYPNVKNKITYLPEKYWKEVNYSDKNRERHPDDKTNIEMYINVSNSGTSVMNVTTNDAEFFENGEKKNPFSKEYPHLIIQLRPNEIFRCRADAVLGVGIASDIWAAAGNCFYEELGDNRFKLTIESLGQMTEFDILDKSCMYIKQKLDNLKFILSEKYNTSEYRNESSLILKLDGEDHTVGNILNEYLQQNKDVLFSGLSKPDLLIQQMVIKLKTTTNNPIQVVLKTIDNIINVFDGIEKQFKKLSK